jgi:hypothetical protein
MESLRDFARFLMRSQWVSNSFITAVENGRAPEVEFDSGMLSDASRCLLALLGSLTAPDSAHSEGNVSATGIARGAKWAVIPDFKKVRDGELIASTQHGECGMGPRTIVCWSRINRKLVANEHLLASPSHKPTTGIG